MKKYKLSSIVVSDIDEAMDYYNEEAFCLGADFFYEFKKTLNFIASFPEIGVFHLRNIRKLSMRRIHHIVFYIYEKDIVHVLAIIHESRGLDYIETGLKDIQ